MRFLSEMVRHADQPLPLPYAVDAWHRLEHPGTVPETARAQTRSGGRDVGMVHRLSGLDKTAVGRGRETGTADGHRHEPKMLVFAYDERAREMETSLAPTRSIPLSVINEKISLSRVVFREAFPIRCRLGEGDLRNSQPNAVDKMVPSGIEVTPE
jgi:hypothetical protein